MSLAARVGDLHTCPLDTAGVPHVGGPIVGPGEASILIGTSPAAHVTDQATCVGPIDTITLGEDTVLIGLLPAVRVGDMTAHGGQVVLGEPSVLIGSFAGANALAEAATQGSAFVARGS